MRDHTRNLRCSKHFLTACFIAVMLSAAGTGMAGETVTLVEDGTPAVIIVLPADPEPGEHQAAAELVEHIALMSGGTEIGVITEGEDPRGRIPILIGRAAGDALADAVMQQQAAQRPHWNIGERIRRGGDTFAFALWVGQDAIQLRGGMGHEGTRTAAYELLEQLGVRWFMPGKYGRHIPERPTLELAVQQTIQIPSFVNRRGPQRIRGDDRYLARVRAGGLGGQPGRHGFPKPDGKNHRQVRDDHPDYYAQCPLSGERGGRQLCVSQAGVLDMVALAIRQQLEADGSPSDTRRIIDVGPHDGGGHCACDGCLAMDAPERYTTPFGGPPAPSRTDRYVGFVNRILEALEDDYPNLRLGIYAYADYELPPVKVEPSGRLAISIAPIRQCRHHGPNNPVCPESNYVRWLYEQWGPHANEIWDRGYLFNLACPGLPISMIHRLQEEIPLFYELGAVGTVPSYASTFATFNPGPYVRNRLAWDHTLDVDFLLEEFYTGFYGAAAAPMEAYHRLIDERHRDGNFHTGASWDIPNFYPPDVREPLRAYLDEGARLAGETGDNVLMTRVEITRKGFDYLEAFCDIIHHRNRFEFVSEKAALDRMKKIRDSLQQDYDANMLDSSHADRLLERFVARITRDTYATVAQGGEIVAPFSHEWAFYLDSEAWGRYMGLHRPESKGGYWKTIRTDQSWSNQGYHHYYGQSWYRQTVTVPAEYEGRPVRIWFAGVNQTAEVWINGRFVGANHDGAEFDLDAYGAAFRPFDLDVADALNYGGDNVVSIRSYRSRAGELGTGGLIGPVMFYVPGRE